MGRAERGMEGGAESDTERGARDVMEVAGEVVDVLRCIYTHRS